jgi:hypothetical protein
MRKLVLAAAAAVLLVGCGGSPPTVQGSIADLMQPAKNGCGGGGDGEQIALTNANGTIIARQHVTFTKSGAWCALPFSFSNVPSLAGYGVRVVGLGGGTVWLTPAQVSRFVNLRIGSGFALSGS